MQTIPDHVLSLFILHLPMVAITDGRCAAAKFFKSRLWDKVPDGSILIFWRYPNFHKIQDSIGRGKSVSKNSAQSMQLF